MAVSGLSPASELPAGGLAADPGQANIPGGQGLSRFRHPVLAFLVRRIATGLLTVLAASLLIFLATNALPGNVSEAVLGRSASPELVAMLNHKLGLDQPVLSRYLSWLTGLIHGDLGNSAVAVAQSNPITAIGSLIATPLVNSLILAVITMIILVPLSLFLGSIAAVHAGALRDYAISYPALMVGALPEFVFGTLLIVVFFSILDWFSPVALIAPGASPLDHLDVLVLPILTLLGAALAFCARQVRAGVLATLPQDYVTMARLGGLRERRVLMRYALRNALGPSIQTFAQSLQYLFGGIIVVEALFTYPGLGSLLVQAVQLRDVTEVQTIAVLFAAAFVAINIVADLAVVFLVPKLRTGLR